jgi:DNA-binding winged helix-turn-helix (wHTH) protein
MQPSPVPPIQLRFGPFEVDLSAAELRKRGRKVPLQDQPFKVLALLLQRPGELVTREELERTLWPGETSAFSAASIATLRITDPTEVSIPWNWVPQSH